LESDDAARLLPDDRLLDIYRAAYPSRQTPDALEFETLLKAIRRLPGLASTTLELPNMTVGEVVALWVGASQETPSPRSAALG